MVAPIENYDTTYYSNKNGMYRKTGQKQAKPYDLVTRCDFVRIWGSSSWEWFDARSWSYGIDGAEQGPFRDATSRLTNRVYEKIVEKLGDSSSFGATLTAELRETLGLVTGTVLKLVRAARHVKRMEFPQAARELGLPYSERIKETVRYTKATKRNRMKRKRVVSRVKVMTLPTGREVQKTLAGGWLMYSYGVKPLTEDLYNAMDVLQRPFPIDKVHASQTGSFDKLFSQRGDSYTHLRTYTQHTMKVRVRAGAFVQVENPNLWLLNKMGLINPVQWANEAIPFSFVVDWFSNLSSVIGSLTDFAGLSVTQSWTSIQGTISETQYGDTIAQYSKSKMQYKRWPGLPTPKLSFAYERVSWQRGLNAISLLIGFLPNR